MSPVAQPVNVAAELEAWVEAALVELPLPSGRRVKVRPSNLMDLYIVGQLPQPLTAIVVATEKPGQPAPEPTTEESRELILAMQELAAKSIEFLGVDAEDWIAVTIDATTFARLPLADRNAISKAALGTEFAEVASGMATFRDEPAGGDPGADGADVRSPAVGAPQPARPNRAARRARS